MAPESPGSHDDTATNNGVSTPDPVEGVDDDRAEGSPHAGDDATTDI